MNTPMINQQKEPQEQYQNEQRQEEWMKPCEQAAVEQDPQLLVVLTREMCRLLDEREKALKNRRHA